MHSPVHETSAIGFPLWSAQWGGAERFSLALATALRKRGVRVTFVFITGEGPFSALAREQGFACSIVGLDRGRSVVLRARYLSRLLTKLAPDGVLLPTVGFLAGTLRAGGYRAPIVGIDYGNVLQLDQLPPLKRAVMRLDRRLGLWALDCHVAISNFTRDVAARYHTGSRFRTIYLGVDPAAYPPATRSDPANAPLRVGFAARLIAGKGGETLVRATALAGEGIELRVAGDGPDRSRLERLAESLGVLPRVRFLGGVRDMASFWQWCDVAVVPSESWSEAFGMVAVEAMSCGRPVIASRQGGLPEVVRDGVTGFIVTPGAVAEFAQALESYRVDPGLRAKHGQSARHHVLEHFNIEGVAGEYEALFEELGKKNRRANQASTSA